jgi:hypothetical protein
MNIEEQYRKPNLISEPIFYFNSSKLAANVAFVKEKKIERLMLISNPDGYNLKDLNFLKELPFIKSLEMGACSTLQNFEGLANLKELETLVFASDKKVEVDLSNLVNLKSLGFTVTPKIKGLDKLINIESLGINLGNDDFYNIEVFSNFKKLNTLKIVQASITDLTFLKQNSNLEDLVLSHMKKAFDLEGIQFLKNSLKKLSLTSSKKIDNVQLISQLVNLETLGFIESVTIESAALLKPLTKLEAFGTYGSSYFVDGDLRSLKHLKDTIKHFKVQDKKHYIYE